MKRVLCLGVLLAFAACANAQKKHSADERHRIDSIPVLGEMPEDKKADYEYFSTILCDGKEVFAAPTEDECNEEFRAKAFEAETDLVIREKVDIRERVHHPKKRAKTYRLKANPNKKYEL